MLDLDGSNAGFAQCSHTPGERTRGIVVTAVLNSHYGHDGTSAGSRAKKPPKWKTRLLAGDVPETDLDQRGCRAHKITQGRPGRVRAALRNEAQISTCLPNERGSNHLAHHEIDREFTDEGKRSTSASGFRLDADDDVVPNRPGVSGKPYRPPERHTNDPRADC